MENRPTYEQFEQKVKELEGESPQRKQVEEALRESEEKYRNILENIEDGYYEVDLAGNLTSFNDSFCRIVGYSEDELMAGNYWQFTDPEATEDVKQAFSDIYTSRKSIKAFDWEIITKDGTKKNIEASISLTKDTNGHRVGFRGIIRDISDRKQAEEALWEKTRLNQILLDALPCVALLLGRDREVVISNKVGQDAGAVAGKPCFTTWGQRDDPCPWCLAPEAFMSGEDQHLELEALGSIWDAHWVPIGPDICLYYAFDVTEQRQMEARIQQVQRMESLGILAEAIANNFNNLLMGIGGNASLMLFDKDSGDPDRKKLRKIEQLVQRGAEMTIQLLSFARSEHCEVRQTDLNDLVKETSEMFGSTKKEIIVFAKYQQEIWRVEVDQAQIKQVLLNLFVNAADAMPGGGTVYLETENVLLNEEHVKPYDGEAGSYVKISVADTGVGIDRQTQEKVFDPFFTTKGKGKGTGLGLSAAYGIIRNHGGVINFKSEKGAGTTFCIYLPVQGATSRTLRGETEDAVEIFRGYENILLVDDEEMIIDVDRELLQKMGYKVYGARSGKEAVEIYKAEKDEIDLVILDMIMPEMGGGETFDRLREINPDVKVLLSSGYSIDGQAREILERGCEGFIQKPFNASNLLSKIRGILDKNRPEFLN